MLQRISQVLFLITSLVMSPTIDKVIKDVSISITNNVTGGFIEYITCCVTNDIAGSISYGDGNGDGITKPLPKVDGW